jgi:hypothetical protein
LPKDLKNRKLSDIESVVLPPGGSALRAAEEPDLALIGRPELAEPPERGIVLAFRAPDRDRRKGRDLLGVVDDHDLLLAPESFSLELVAGVHVPDIATFPAFQLAARRDHQAFTFRTEHGKIRYDVNQD